MRACDVFWWVDSFIRAATSRDLRDFPLLEEHIPDREERAVG